MGKTDSAGAPVFRAEQELLASTASPAYLVQVGRQALKGRQVRVVAPAQPESRVPLAPRVPSVQLVRLVPRAQRATPATSGRLAQTDPKDHSDPLVQLA